MSVKKRQKYVRKRPRMAHLKRLERRALPSVVVDDVVIVLFNFMIQTFQKIIQITRIRHSIIIWCSFVSIFLYFFFVYLSSVYLSLSIYSVSLFCLLLFSSGHSLYLLFLCLFLFPSLPLFVFFGWAISRCLSTTPHPIWGQGGSILLVHYSMIVLKPAILIIMAVISLCLSLFCFYVCFSFLSINLCLSLSNSLFHF